MDRAQASAAVVDHLLRRTQARADLVSTAPLVRPADIRLATWLPWLLDGGRRDTDSYVGPLEPRRVSAAKDAIRALTRRDGTRRGADCEIDREILATLATSAARGNERRCIGLWVASMMWGSSTLNARGPWRTAQALASDDLGEILVIAHRELRAGDVSDAYTTLTAIQGAGEAFATTFLWAASLGLDLDEPCPLVLEERTRAALTDADVRPVANGRGYADYLAALHDAAAVLRDDHGLNGATPEKLEWILSSPRPI